SLAPCLPAGAGHHLGAALGAARGVAHDRADVAAALGLLARRAGRGAGRGLPVSALRIIVFAKAPRPGLAKTRLIPALGAAGAATLAARMLAHTLDQTLASGVGVVELCA